MKSYRLCLFAAFFIFLIQPESTLAFELQKGPVTEFKNPARPAEEETSAPAQPSLETIFYKVNNYRASLLGDSVKFLLSPSGIIQSNDDLNVLLISDAADKLAAIRKTLADIDALPEQIVIQAKVLEVSDDFADDTGIDISTAFERGYVDYSMSGQSNKSHQSSTSPSYGYSPNQDTFSHQGAKSSRLGWSSIQLSQLINFAVEKGYGKILAEPQIVTTNNKMGRFFIGNRVQLANSMVLNGTINSQYSVASSYPSPGVISDNAGLVLEVTPRKGQSDFITLEITTELGELDGVNSSYTNVFTRSAVSTVIARDGEPFVLGGYKKSEETHSEKKFPLLGDIPILKSIFSKKMTSTDEVELILVLTPYIVKPGEGAKKPETAW